MKPWLERVPSRTPSYPDNTAWKRRDYAAEKQRELELRDWLAANAHIFQTITGHDST